MPAKRDDDKNEKPVEMTNPATSAHAKDAPDAQPAADEPKPAPEKAQADAPAEEPAPPAAPRRTIEELLRDPSFDPDGLVRSKLAAHSAQHGVGHPAPADLVDDAGMPVAQG